MVRYTYEDAVRSKKVLYAAVIIVVAAVAGLLIFRHFHHPDKARQEMLAMRNAVGKLVILPQGEDPTLATVQDKTKLTDAFLKANAENGDKVLVYANAQKVYIYRPSKHKLVTMGPLNIDASAAQVQGARILVRTGNGNPGLSETIRKDLIQNYPSARISIVEEAKRQDYPSTIVIDLTGEKYELVENMRQKLSAQRGILPTNEPKPENTDILIITGLDR